MSDWEQFCAATKHWDSSHWRRPYWHLNLDTQTHTTHKKTSYKDLRLTLPTSSPHDPSSRTLPPTSQLPPRYRDLSVRSLPAYQAPSLDSWDNQSGVYRSHGDLTQPSKCGWLIFMSFGHCSRSLALAGNYPADQSTAPVSRPLWQFCSPGLLFGRRCCGGSETLFCCRLTSGRRSDSG